MARRLTRSWPTSRSRRRPRCGLWATTKTPWRDLAVYISGARRHPGHDRNCNRLGLYAFGQLTHESYLSGNYDTSFGYTGCYYDSATKLQWNLNRWYNPSIQRWMSEDPCSAPIRTPTAIAATGPLTDGTDPSGMVPPGVVLSSNSVGVIHPPAPARPCGGADGRPVCFRVISAVILTPP